MKYFHGTVSRVEAEGMLERDGDFLVRESGKQPGQYVLTGMGGGKAQHLLLIDKQGKVGLQVAGGVRDGVQSEGGVRDGVQGEGGVRNGVQGEGGVMDGVQAGVRDGVQGEGGVRDGVQVRVITNDPHVGKIT